MSNTIIIKTAMNEAYWQAARAMCPNCAYLNDPTRRGDEFVHITGDVGKDLTYHECYAGPIHALIENLNEGQG